MFAAGLHLDKVVKSQTSVYTASFSDDFRLLMYRDAERLPTYSISGTLASFLANRISWFFDFKGPSVHIDTACSSGLAALDHACEGLRTGAAHMVSFRRGRRPITSELMTDLRRYRALLPVARLPWTLQA